MGDLLCPGFNAYSCSAYAAEVVAAMALKILKATGQRLHGVVVWNIACRDGLRGPPALQVPRVHLDDSRTGSSAVRRGGSLAQWPWLPAVGGLKQGFKSADGRANGR